MLRVVNVGFRIANEMCFFAEKSLSSSSMNNHVTEIISSPCSGFLEKLISHKSNENLLKR